MLPVSKTQVRFVGGDELVARDICCFTTGPKFLEAETVEVGRGGVVLAVEVDGGGGYFDDYPWRDVLAVGLTLVHEVSVCLTCSSYIEVTYRG